jgi:hypothetical protein
MLGIGVAKGKGGDAFGGDRVGSDSNLSPPGYIGW